VATGLFSLLSLRMRVIVSRQYRTWARSITKVSQTAFANAKMTKHEIAVIDSSWARREMSFNVSLFFAVLYIWGMKLKKPMAVPTLSRTPNSNRDSTSSPKTAHRCISSSGNSDAGCG
jgi:hypothetical protein